MWIKDLCGSVSEWRQQNEGRLAVTEVNSGAQELCSGGQESQALETTVSWRPKDERPEAGTTSCPSEKAWATQKGRHGESPAKRSHFPRI